MRLIAYVHGGYPLNVVLVTRRNKDSVSYEVNYDIDDAKGSLITTTSTTAAVVAYYQSNLSPGPSWTPFGWLPMSPAKSRPC